MTLRAKIFLELEVSGYANKEWQLAAWLKERPDFLAKSLGHAPAKGGPCPGLEECASELAEQVLGSPNYHRLLSYYIKTGTREASLQVLSLYETAVPTASLHADDLVAQGDALFNLGEYDAALEKYAAALSRDSKFCPALVARGYLYYSRPHGSNYLADLKLAEKDFRSAVSCDPQNEFAHANLGNTLLHRWTSSRLAPDPQLLAEARQHCEIAFQINPQLVTAAIDTGYIIYRQGQHDEALHYFDNLSAKFQDDAALFLNYGYLLYLEYLSGRDEALKLATTNTLRSWSISSRIYGTANNLGFFYYEAGDYVHAVEFWKKANALNELQEKKDADCVAGLALGTSKLGNYREAIFLLQRAIQIDPHYVDLSYLENDHDWSKRAAADLGILIKGLPPAPKRSEP